MVTEIIHTDGQASFHINVRNTGVCLSKIKAITNGLMPAVDVSVPSPNETVFTLQIPLTSAKEEAVQDPPMKVDGQPVPVFFEEVRKRLQRYFSRTNNHLENVQSLEPRKAAFLTRINECILQHLHQEDFDATALSNEMAMSRAQLFRRLKPIISQPPASYIKAIRLQKAKELLETSDLSVSEVAYKTGFKTPSHFTKVFNEKFGIRPSVFATAKFDATNK
ncbi:hypothetical protein SAE01_39450 [Segetibacter aerophilus]|uniref:HTH araC/xylS-type domain-containing protein n=1 Tax=Segetibacter aerophilus TaxID=670293 RepID=A0A512BHI1_9BACT|nr:hypothetical protein SAE01_39450 [Segetibacter aerophilus]